VDDIVLTGSSPVLLNNIVAHLRAEFAVKDMGELRFFLGIDIKRTSAGFFLSQERYTDDILQRPCMTRRSTPRGSSPLTVQRSRTPRPIAASQAR
jgi:hypothetical protein